jgi:anaerobic magnesium-protoporphyrin IX monomethyl ester cyclase
MKEINILLISPSATPLIEQTEILSKPSGLRKPDFATPVGLLELASYLKKNTEEINIELLDFGVDLHKIYYKYESCSPMTFDEFVMKKLESVKFVPDIIGLSVMFSVSHKSSLLSAKICKERWNNAIIICGGSHATSYHDVLLQDVNIDYVLRGMGELSFTEFIHRFRLEEVNKGDIDVFGIYNRTKIAKEKQYVNSSPGDSKISEKHSLLNINNEVSKIIDNLDKIPLPAYELLDLEYYRGNSNDAGFGAISTIFSRGCPFKCTFCATHIVHTRSMYFKSNDRIIEELCYIIDDLGFRRIKIYDDLFTAKKKEFINLVSMILERGWGKGNVEFVLPNGLNVSLLNKEIVDALGELGITFFRLALESGSEYTQKHIIKKFVNLNKAAKILEYIRKKGYVIEVNIIFGFPGETLELMHETIEYLYSIDIDWANIFTAVPVPGTEMFDQFVEEGAIDIKTIDWDLMRVGHRSFDTATMLADDLMRLQYNVHIDRNFFSNNNLQQGRWEKAIEYFTNNIINRYHFHIVAIYCRGLAYKGLNMQQTAEEDFKKCAELVNGNEESEKLFFNYGGKMPLLKPFLEKKYHKVIDEERYSKLLEGNYKRW